jgi:hypothetical protein
MQKNVLGKPICKFKCRQSLQDLYLKKVLVLNRLREEYVTKAAQSSVRFQIIC